MSIMSNQGEQQIPTRSSSFGTILRSLFAIGAAVVAIALVAGTWSSARAATGEIPMRIFLVSWAMTAIVVVFGFIFAGRVRRPVLPTAVQHAAVGFVVGLAIGTTDWTALRLAGWWQMWWTVPLVLAYAGLLITLRRFSRTRP